jgi:hypothetical protein
LESEGRLGAESGQLHVIGGVRRCKDDAGHGLDSKRHQTDDGATEVGLPEAFEECYSLCLTSDFLKGQLHDGETLAILALLISETLKGSEGLVISAL